MMDGAFGVLFSLQSGTPGHGRWVVECLKGSWDKMVGRKLAAVCNPVRLTGTILKIEVIDDAWMHVVRNMRAELQERIRFATRGAVNTLHFSLKRD